MASPAGGDPVLPVGAGGVSWAVLRGRKGRRRWGGSLALGKGRFVSGMGRGRVDGSCCASVLGAPLRVRELLENETKPPRKVLCAYSKPGTHSEYTPRSWRQFSPRDDNVPVCLAPHKGLPVISLSYLHQQLCGAGIFTWSLISPLETVNRVTCLQVTQLERVETAISTRFV